MANKIKHEFENQPLLLKDGKVGLVIRLWWNEDSLGVQVPGEADMRTVKNFENSGGVLFEVAKNE
jgi:hypothetical protein